MRVSRKSIGGMSATSTEVQTATIPGMASAPLASIDMMRPCAWPERTTPMCSIWGKAISAAKAPRPVTSGRSSRRLTERPITLMSGPYLGMSPFAPYCQPLKPGEIYEVDLEIWPMGLALPEGSRLTLAIQGQGLQASGRPASVWLVSLRDDPTDFAGTNTLHTGGQYQSYLLLPMLPKQ